MQRGRLTLRAAAAAVITGMLALTTTARADMISIVADTAHSTEGIGDFTGTIDYSFDGVVGNLVITLTNTSPGDTHITAFIFNIEGTLSDADLVSSTHPFEDAAESNGAPFGGFEAGAGLYGAFLGGGNPNPGIDVGETGTFIFEVTGLDASSLTAASFLAGDDDFNFIVRFRGGNVQSDKVPAVMLGGEVIPLPAPLALGLVGLIGAAAGSRRLRRGR